MAKKSKRGAPTKYDPAYCEMMIAYMAKGYSFTAFAASIDVCRDTLHEWATQHGEFSDAKKRASQKCQQFWESQMIDGLYSVTTRDADGGSCTVSINASIVIFNMKARFKWRDRHEVSTPKDERKEASENLDKLVEAFLGAQGVK